MSYLQCAKKDVNKVRFVKYSSKYQNENKITDIARERIMFFASGKEAWKQILNFQVYQMTDGTKTRTYAGLKNLFRRYRRNLN